MLSNNLRKAFDDIESRDPDARVQRSIYSLFLDIALTISRLRQEKGLTQRELASQMKTSHPTIVRWETPGYSGYTLAKLVELADILDYQVELKFAPKRTSVTNTQKPTNSWDGEVVLAAEIEKHQNSKATNTSKAISKEEVRHA